MDISTFFIVTSKRSFCLKRQTILKTIFLSLVLATFSTSCGLIEKFKTPEQPTESATTAVPAPSEADDLFSKTINETKDIKEEPLIAKSDAPSNIDTTETPAEVKDELKSLEDEFANNTPKTEPVAEVQQVKVEESLPEITASELPVVADNTNSDAGKVMSYKVQKGETLMQIAFKIYGDVSKWKAIQQMNDAKLSKNSALRANMELKYTAPEKIFVWNPEGTPYMIKNGETLGTISNSVYQTPKKWKSIWENNKPLIKNPNVIYAGFTLFYKGSGMANYVQPKAAQRKVAAKASAKVHEIKNNDIEEVKVDKAISDIEHLDANETQDLTQDFAQETKASEVESETVIR
jgi:nucleoid-associated protein YgaU